MTHLYVVMTYLCLMKTELNFILHCIYAADAKNANCQNIKTCSFYKTQKFSHAHLCDFTVYAPHE